MTDPAIAARLKAILEEIPCDTYEQLSHTDRDRCKNCGQSELTHQVIRAAQAVSAHVETLTQQVAEQEAPRLKAADHERERVKSARMRATMRLETWLAIMLDKQQTDGDDVEALRLAISALAHVETLEHEKAELAADFRYVSDKLQALVTELNKWRIRAEQAEQQRDAAHAALRDLREAVLSRACVESQHCGIDTDPAMALADAALAASAPQEKESKS